MASITPHRPSTTDETAGGWYQHPRALVESDRIGRGTRVWAFAHVLPGAVIGQECNICDGVFVENDVVIGDRVTVKCGVQVWDGITLEDDVFVGPNATFTNDAYPRSRQFPERFLRTVVHRGASIGANATILPGLRIGAHAMIGAGAVVTHDVPPHAIVIGNPGRVTGFIEGKTPTTAASARITSDELRELRIGTAALVAVPVVTDRQGRVAVADLAAHLPFAPRRCQALMGNAADAMAGGYACRSASQFVICVAGSLTCALDDGQRREEVVLDAPSVGLHLPAMTWMAASFQAPGTIAIVLRSDPPDDADVVRDYGEFHGEAAKR